MSETITIDGHGPLPVVKPASVAEVCALVKQQRARKEAVYTVGGRTMLDFGLPPTKPGLALDTTALNRVIDYPANDMTITVQPGITMAELQKTLAAHNQWLPLDVPDPDRMTLGGVIACNVSGPRRLGYGTIRDYLIGISFVGDDGVEIKGGGRVVKNVAGYDLMKLHIGALGTMGVITQATLKVRPRPEASAAILLKLGSGHSIMKTADTIFASKSRPVVVDLHMQTGSDYQLVIGYEEKTTTLNWQIETAAMELNGIGLKPEMQLGKAASHHFKTGLNDRIDGSIPFAISFSVKPADAMESIVNVLTRSTIRSHYFNGVIWMFSHEEPESPQRGCVVIARSPIAWKTPERVFGKPTPAFELMRHIQRTLDPDGVFNPGRMFAM